MPKVGKIEKKQTVTVSTTPSTDPKETREREGRAERLAKGEARWDTSGKRTDKGGKESEE